MFPFLEKIKNQKGLEQPLEKINFMISKRNELPFKNLPYDIFEKICGNVLFSFLGFYEGENLLPEKRLELFLGEIKNLSFEKDLPRLARENKIFELSMMLEPPENVKMVPLVVPHVGDVGAEYMMCDTYFLHLMDGTLCIYLYGDIDMYKDSFMTNIKKSSVGYTLLSNAGVCFNPQPGYVIGMVREDFVNFIPLFDGIGYKQMFPEFRTYEKCKDVISLLCEKFPIQKQN